MADCSSPMYLLAGGHRHSSRQSSEPLMQAVLQRIGVRHPKIAYVGAASGDNPGFRELIATMLREAGAGQVTLAPLCGRRADRDEAEAVLEGADLVFISGGDVEEGIRVLRQNRITLTLEALHGRGVPFVGVSAGSIMLAHHWVRWGDPEDDDTAELFPCLGFAPVLCDTHGEEEGWAELRAALTLSPVGTTGYGIVSGAALVVQTDGHLCALGGKVNVFRHERSGLSHTADLAPAGG